MAAAAKAVKVINVLMHVTSEMSGLLGNTTPEDLPGRSLRLVDQLVGMSVQSIKIGMICGATEEKITEGVEQFAAIACRHLQDLQRWLDEHPAYVSQTSDGRARAGKPVDCSVIRSITSDVLVHLRGLLPSSNAPVLRAVP